MTGVAFTRSRFTSLSLTCPPIVAPRLPRWLRTNPRPFVMVATHWCPSTPTPVVTICWRLLGCNRHPCYVWVQRHDTYPRDFIHILSLACIVSSPVCHPSHNPNVPTPFLPYASDATPSHAHRIILAAVRHSIAFSFSLVLLSDTIVIHAFALTLSDKKLTCRISIYNWLRNRIAFSPSSWGDVHSKLVPE